MEGLQYSQILLHIKAYQRSDASSEKKNPERKAGTPCPLLVNYTWGVSVITGDSDSLCDTKIMGQLPSDFFSPKPRDVNKHIGNRGGEQKKKE